MVAFGIRDGRSSRDAGPFASSGGLSSSADTRRGVEGCEAAFGVEALLGRGWEGVPDDTAPAELPLPALSLSPPNVLACCAVSGRFESWVGAFEKRLDERHRLRRDCEGSWSDEVLSFLDREDEDDDDEEEGTRPIILRRSAARLPFFFDEV